MEIESIYPNAEQAWDLGSGLSSESSLSSTNIELHNTIFSPPPHPLFSPRHSFSAISIPHANGSEANVAVCANGIRPKAKSGGSGEVYIEYTDDGKGNGEWSAGGKGEWHDDDGNYIKGGGEINSDGSSRYYGGAGRREE